MFGISRLFITVWVICWYQHMSDAFHLSIQSISAPSRHVGFVPRSQTPRVLLNVHENQNDEPPSQDREDFIAVSSNLGEFNPSKKIPIKREVVVGDPQQRLLKEKEISVTAILKELAAIQAQGPQKYCILGSRHCSFLHQQIVELL
jgi:hypothetical protein